MLSCHFELQKYLDQFTAESMPTVFSTDALNPFAHFSLLDIGGVLMNDELSGDDAGMLHDVQRWMAMSLAQEPVFQKLLKEKLDAAGYKHSYPTFYKQADIDRRLFSKIISETYIYHPDIRTVFKCIIGLHMDLEQAQQMLSAAAYSFGTDRSNLIIRYCIEHGIYDHSTIDQLLYEFGEDTLYSMA